MENQKHHYTGLTDAEVIESRQKNGVNILTPPVKETFWDKVRATCTHWISIAMMILFAGSLIAAGLLSASMGDKIWVMPTIVLISTLLIAMVGIFGGFKDALFKILITAFVLSMGIAIYEFEWGGKDATSFLEPIGIIVALILATGVAFLLERRNEKTFQSLNEVNDETPVKVVRNNHICQVPRKDIVVGDIVLVETGDEVPADCELLESLNLMVDESTLTGEPQASKTTDPAKFDTEATYPSNHILKGTTIREGYGTARVIRVGDRTESGKVFEAAQVNEGESTPLTEKLENLAQWITKASYIVAALIIAGRIIRYFITGEASLSTSDDWFQFISYLLSTVMIAVTLIVVSVPEGLPMSVTLSLAFSMRKLMKENTLPRTMHACETMGATSVICTDKTGTLTQNQMRVSETAFEQLADQRLTEDMASRRIAECIAANTTANLDTSNPDKPQAIGNPTEGALLLWLHDQGINYLELREKAEISQRLPFTTELKYMATVTTSAITGKRMLYVKGAPEIVLALTTADEDTRAAVSSRLLAYQSRAMRTLAFACKELEENGEPFRDGKLATSELTYLGIVSIADPIRKEVPDAIKDCISAGIQVKIVTGDTIGTAKEIGRQVGLWQDTDSDDHIMTGQEIEALSDEELKERIPEVKIISRARPHDKERIVRALRKRDMVVAVTGDGTNDAPALNAADVGLSMGDGTAVAKEASDMTILDNSMRTISNAVMWGRSLYRNIQRFLLFQLTVNVSACLIVLVGAFIGTQSPLTVTQMLWVNLIMDTFAAIALASLPPSKRVMLDKPRDRKASILDKSMKTNIFCIGGLFFLIQLILLLIFENAEINSLADLLHIQWQPNNGLSPYEGTLFFNVFVLTHFWYLFDARAYKTGRSALHLAKCEGFLLISVVILLGQVAMLYIPGFNTMFNCTPMPIGEFLIITGLSSLVLWFGELGRLFKKETAPSAGTC
ncbi:MAG: calcium-translocating P-type ATPase, PMCA-type [Bacteroidales bacterium]|nr:calcium-translocating P-type ATPase, PMCA-type [Bacteroidales bacterium]